MVKAKALLKFRKYGNEQPYCHNSTISFKLLYLAEIFVRTDCDGRQRHDASFEHSDGPTDFDIHQPRFEAAFRHRKNLGRRRHHH
jgi:hypothetical protein